MHGNSARQKHYISEPHVFLHVSAVTSEITFVIRLILFSDLHKLWKKSVYKTSHIFSFLMQSTMYVNSLAPIKAVELK